MMNATAFRTPVLVLRLPHLRRLVWVCALWLVFTAAGRAGELAGHQLLVTMVRTGDTEIFIVDPDTGDCRNLTRSPKSEERYPCWSPDGKQVAFISDRDGAPNLYVINADGTGVRRLTNTPAVCYMPSWSGDRIVFGMHGDKPEMASIKSDGTDLRMLGEGHDPCLSPDGKLIAYTGHVPGGVTVFLMNADGSDKRQLVQEVNPFGAVFPSWSPDGKQIVFSGKDGEALELFIVNVDGSGLHQLTHLGKVCTPAAWSPDGQWISFRYTDERYWGNPERMKKIYAEHPADKRPVWVIRPDGKDAHVIECLRFQCAMDGSRAAWKPR
jgi:TolB protein